MKTAPSLYKKLFLLTLPIVFFSTSAIVLISISKKEIHDISISSNLTEPLLTEKYETQPLELKLSNLAPNFISDSDNKSISQINSATSQHHNFTTTNSIMSFKVEDDISAFSLSYPRGIEFSLSYDGINFQEIHEDTEGILKENVAVSELLFPDDNFSGDLFIKSDLEFEFTIDVIPKEENQIIYKANSYTQSQYSGALYTKLNIIPRSVWGANPQNWDPYSNLDINSPDRLVWDAEYYRPEKIVVHHTATPYRADPSQSVREIYLYHAYSRGWGDIGYNYLIDQYGNIYEGKIGGEGVMSYHAYREANISSISISMIGDFTYSEPTAAAKDALAKLIAEKSNFYNWDINPTNGSLSDWLDTNKTLFGHKTSYFWCFPGHPMEYMCGGTNKWVQNATACPGASFYPILTSEIITKARTYKESSIFTNIKSISNDVNNTYLNKYTSLEPNLILHSNLELTNEIISNNVPKYSGISNTSFSGQVANLTVNDWYNGGDVPYDGWRGFDTPVFPLNIKWKEERLKTLHKILILSNNWGAVDRDYLRTSF